ncbi:hypothetical protein T552_00652 [Pneumocystis carinii B80]|uniref:RRM domain-containing protein n=1 Tax=Pneumocystis carinii (strain B80) TaxID=1408658 RepID=A0A0W4ZP90_PNEC8|nr:hypothetical protein T552_00652 [Pneumocystis carinii B80]KTW30175.1 hypothetical protein T552_00652 [Pneumocystis carinii B80]
MTPLDKSLDEIIASRPSGRIRRAPKRMRKIKTRLGTRKITQIVSATTAAAAIQAVMEEGSKIIVSNLPSDVTEAQIKDLFSKSIGPTRRCFLSYGPNGQSKGIATVIFQRKADASRAYAQYEGRLIDGVRKMKVEIVLDPGKSMASSSLSQRIAPGISRGRRLRKPGKGMGRFKRVSRPKKTLEELDAEMIDYFGSANQEIIA